MNASKTARTEYLEDTVYWLNRVGVGYWRKNQNKQAERIFDKVIKLDEKNGKAFAYRSTIKKEMGDIWGFIWDLGMAKSLGLQGRERHINSSCC